LIAPVGMGNIFKVLVQRRAVPPSELSGLKFERQKSEDEGSSEKPGVRI